MVNVRKKIEDLGNWAENRFAAYCSEAGVTANKSLQDRTGWDYLLEFKQPNSPNIPLDRCKSEVTARVQVKSRERGKLSTSIKLDHAHRFASSPDPCFIVLAAATNGAEPVRFYAKHFWKEEIKRTLKRLRQAEHKTKPTHKQSVQINFFDEDEHTHDLMEWMKNAANYYERNDRLEKEKLFKNLGYSNDSTVGTFTFSLNDLNSLINHSIGLEPNFQPNHVILIDKRFGIESKHPIFDGKPDYAVIESKPRSCTLEFIDNKNNSHIFEGEFRAPILPDLPREIFRCSVIAGPITLVLSGNYSGNVNIKLDLASQYCIDDLFKYIYFYESITNGPFDIIMRLDQDDYEISSVEINENSQIISFNTCSYMLKTLLDISQQHERSKIKFSINELMDKQDIIFDFCTYVTTDDMTFNFGSSEYKEQISNLRRFLLPVTLEFGTLRFSVLRSFQKVAIEDTGSGTKIACSDPINISMRADHASSDKHVKFLHEAVARNSTKHVGGTGSVDTIEFSTVNAIDAPKDKADD